MFNQELFCVINCKATVPNNSIDPILVLVDGRSILKLMIVATWTRSFGSHLVGPSLVFYKISEITDR